MASPKPAPWLQSLTLAGLAVNSSIKAITVHAAAISSKGGSWSIFALALRCTMALEVEVTEIWS